MIMYRLSKTQCNHLKKQISVTVDQKITSKTKRSQMIYETRYLKRILQSLHQERKKMTNSFSNKIQIVQISSYAVQINKCVSDVSETNQSHIV